MSVLGSSLRRPCVSSVRIASTVVMAELISLKRTSDQWQFTGRNTRPKTSFMHQQQSQADKETAVHSWRLFAIVCDAVIHFTAIKWRLNNKKNPAFVDNPAPFLMKNAAAITWISGPPYGITKS